MLEGQRIEILGPFLGDSSSQSALWIPSIRTIIASDTVFNHAHVWVADDKTPAMRQKWLSVLDQLEQYHPEIAILGYSPDAIDFPRQYIKTFKSITKNATDSQDIIRKILTRYSSMAAKICLGLSTKFSKIRIPGLGNTSNHYGDLTSSFNR